MIGFGGHHIMVHKWAFGVNLGIGSLGDTVK